MPVTRMLSRVSFRPQALGEAGQGELAREVGDHVRRDRLAADRDDVGDPARTACARMWGRAASVVWTAPQKFVSIRLPIVVLGHRRHRPDDHDPRVVDQHVDPPEPLDRPRDEGPRLLGDRSRRSGRPGRPSAPSRTSAAAASRSPASRAARTSVAPRRAACLARIRPRPVEAPVMTTTLPANSIRRRLRSQVLRPSSAPAPARVPISSLSLVRIAIDPRSRSGRRAGADAVARADASLRRESAAYRVPSGLSLGKATAARISWDAVEVPTASPSKSRPGAAMPGRVFITRPIPEPGPSLLARVAGQVERTPRIAALTPERLRRPSPGRDGVLCLLTDTDRRAGPGGGRGVPGLRQHGRRLQQRRRRRRRPALGILVTNTPGVLTEATADLTWALILAVARRVVEGDAEMRAGRFPGWGPLYMLGGDVTGRDPRPGRTRPDRRGRRRPRRGVRDATAPPRSAAEPRAGGPRARGPSTLDEPARRSPTSSACTSRSRPRRGT